MSINAEISVGEFLDKLTILQIKREKIKDPDKLANINHELDTLVKIWQKAPYVKPDLQDDVSSLHDINRKLWNIEDDIRDKESKKEFDQEFIELARSVYKTNNKRAKIKKQINQKSGSVLVEEKSYKDYR